METVTLKVQVDESQLTGLETKITKLQNKTIKLKVDTSGLTALDKQTLATLKSVTQYVSAVARAENAQANLSKEARQVASALNQQDNAVSKAAKSMKTLDQETENAKKSSESLWSMIKKNTIWYYISGMVSGLTNAFKDALSTMKEVDNELTNIQKVTGRTTEEMERLGDAAYSTASKYGVSANEYLESVGTFSKAGYGGLSEGLGELAIKTQLVGDVTAETADQFLLAVDAAYGMEGSVNSLSTVLDKANAIENNYATSIEKLADGMPIVANVAAMANMSIDETMAALGTITATTQETGSKAATALRALILNILGDTTTEIEEGVTLTEENLETLSNILWKYSEDAMKAAQATGEIVNPMEAIAGLAKAAQEGLLTEQELADIASSIGGKLRTNQLLALIENFDTYNSMLQTVKTSAGSADAEVGVMLTSWDAKVNILNNTWTEFVAKTVNSNWIKGLIDAVTWLIDGFDNLGNVLITVGGALLALKLPTIISYFKSLGSQIKSVAETVILFAMEAKSAGGGIKGLTSGFKALGSSVKTAQSAIGAAIAVITTILFVINKVTQAQEQARAEAAEYAEETLNTVDSLQSLKQEYIDIVESEQSEADKTSALIAWKEKLAETYDIEKEKLDEVNLSRQTGIDLLNDEAEKNINAAITQLEDYDESVKQIESPQSLYLGRYQPGTFSQGFLEQYGITATETVGPSGEKMQQLTLYADNAQEASDKLEQLNSDLRINNNLLSEEEKLLGLSSARYNETNKVIETWGDTYTKGNELYADKIALDNEETIAALDSAEAYEVWRDAIVENSGAQGGYKDELIETLDAMWEYYHAEEAAAESGSAMSGMLEELSENSEAYSQQIDSLQSALKTLQSAQEEYNQHGELSIDTIQNLLQLDAEYLKALVDENGQINLNSGAVATLINDKTAYLQALAAEQVATYAVTSLQERMAEATANAGQSADNSKIGIENASMSMMNMAAQGITAAVAVTELDKALDTLANEQGASAMGVDVEAWKQDVKTYAQSVASLIQNAGSGIGGWTGSYKSAASAASGISNANQKIEDEEESIQDAIEEHIQSLEDIVSLRESELDLLEAQGASTKSQIEKIHQIQDAIQDQLAYMKSVGSSQEEINDLTAEWYKWNEEIKDLQQEMWDALEDAIDQELEKAEKQRDEALEALDAELDKLKEQRDVKEDQVSLEEKLLAVQEAQVALANAQAQRTVRYYNATTGQWEWGADIQEVEDAKQALEDAQQDLADYQDELAYDAAVEAIESKKEAIEAEYEAVEASWNQIIESLQEPTKSITEVLKEIGDNATPDMLAQIQTINGLLKQFGYSISTAAISKPAQSSSASSSTTSGTSSTGKSIDELAREVIRGNWGSGADRKNRLTAAGYDYSAVQSRVNQMMSSGVYDEGGVLRGIGGIKATSEDEMILPPDITAALLKPIKTPLAEQRMEEMRYLYSTTGVTPPPSMINNRIGSQYNGDIYQFAGIQLTQQQAKSMTVYDLAQMSRSLGIYQSN